jgi:hypothetical protein
VNAHKAVLIYSSLLFLRCDVAHRPAAPSIEFTKLPPFGAGSSSKLEAIEGRATGVRAGQKIVLYARSGQWWVQPLADHPFTAVQADFSWRNKTHPGSAYAALLVTDGYRPGITIETLPEKGGAVLAVVATENSGVVGTGEKTLRFGGYRWQIRDQAYEPGGSRNDYDPSNAWVDRADYLHLRITGRPGQWKSAEVNLTRSLGYGAYCFVLRGVSHLEPAAVFTMTTQDDNSPWREMDIELSRWGEPDARNAQFVIQPYYIPANTVRFETPAGVVTFMMRWEPGRASFRAFRGAVSRWNLNPVREHVFTSGVPVPGHESVHLNFYVFDQVSDPLRRPTEVIVERFEYLP